MKEYKNHPSVNRNQKLPQTEGYKKIHQTKEHQKRHQEKECKNMPKLQECKKGRTIDLSEPSHPPCFHDLTRLEIKKIFNFMYAQETLNIVKPSDAVLASNYIFSMELILPEKKEDFQSTPTRRALVTFFEGARTPPIVNEYCVELSSPLQFCGSPHSIQFSFRPSTVPEFNDILNVVFNKAESTVGNILEQSYHATILNCGKTFWAWKMSVLLQPLLLALKDKTIEDYGSLFCS